jgi:hypothetical protein
MQFRLSLLLSLSLGFGCGSNEGKSSSQLETQDSFERVSHRVKASEGMDANEKIIGLWTDGSSENASFKIGKDSVYYVDKFISYPYYTDDSDSIHIKFEDYIFSAHLSWHGDTLVFTDQDNVATKYTRFLD